MNDREKVIKGLECCKSRSTCNDECPYYHVMEDPNFGMDDCTSMLASEALSLLKAQDEVITELLKVGYPHDFQNEPLWIVNYMRLITGVMKKAVNLRNDES